MSKIFIRNGHQPSPFAPGTLNATLVTRAEESLSDLGHALRVTRVAEGFDVDQEIVDHQ